MKEITASEPDWTLRGILISSFVLSLCCLIKLWRRKGNLWLKIIWSGFVFVPFLGPLFFAMTYHSPEAQSEGDQCVTTSDAEHLS